MNLLVLEPLDAEVIEWLGRRHAVRVAPELARDPAALRESLHSLIRLVTFARERYNTDKATYHVSATLASAPPAVRSSTTRPGWMPRWTGSAP